MTSIMVEVPAEEFIRTHRGLVNLIQTIDRFSKTEDGELPTNKLCLAAFGTRSKYCLTQIELAEKLGYIKRKSVRRLKVDGTASKMSYIVNMLTPKGKALLEELRV